MHCEHERFDNYGVWPRCKREATHVLKFDGSRLNHVPSDEYFCSPHAAAIRRELKRNAFGTLTKLPKEDPA